MNYKDNIEQKNLLNAFLKAHHIVLSNEILDKLYCYSDLVVQTREFGNLVSENDGKKFLSRHIADSLIPYIFVRGEINSTLTQKDKVPANPQLIFNNCKWADMGSGSGCPIYPLAIVMPEVNFYAVEPRNKRIQFLEFAKEKLELKNLTIIGKRFETSGLKNLNFISCRALSTFENDWERAKPSLKKGGIFCTLKSLNSVAHLENDHSVSLIQYHLPQEEQIYALAIRGKNE